MMIDNWRKIACHHRQMPHLNQKVRHLLDMDDRIRVYPLYGDLDDKKGFFVTKDHIFIPHELPRLEHDICHLVEMNNPERWTKPDWGMPRFADDCLPKSAFFASLAREVRTRAIQLHTQPEKVGDERSTVYNPLANSYWFGMAEKLCPFGRFKNIQDVQTWMCDLREKTYQRWSMDRITHEWQIRLNHIQNWMETV